MKITRKNGMSQTWVNGRFIQHKDFDVVMRSALNELGFFRNKAL